MFLHFCRYFYKIHEIRSPCAPFFAIFMHHFGHNLNENDHGKL